MARAIRDLLPKDLEFQMFVLDELADDLMGQDADVIKLTIGVPELPIPECVLERMTEKLHDPQFVLRVYPEELREMYAIVDRQAYILNDEIYNNTMFTLISSPPARCCLNTMTLRS